MVRSSFAVAALALCGLVCSISAFSTAKSRVSSTSMTSLSMARLSNDDDKHHNSNPWAASVVAAAYILGGLATVAEPAQAYDGVTHNPSTIVMDNGPSSTLLAARSGGRAGGRAMSRPPMRSSAPSRGYSGGGYSGGGGGYTRSSTTIIRPMIVSPSPFGYGGGYGYGNPMGGLGLGYGLGSMNNAGNEVRDYRQETEIQQSKAELEQAKQKQAELEARLKLLEQNASQK